MNIQAISDNGEGQDRASMDIKISSDYGSQVPPNVIWRFDSLVEFGCRIV